MIYFPAATLPRGPHDFPLHPAAFSAALPHSAAAAALSAHHPHPLMAALAPHHLAAAVGAGKRKKSWTRAVFSNLQRKGLEKRFQIQKYITKPDRRQLAASLGLTDAQVIMIHSAEIIYSFRRKMPKGANVFN